MIEYLRPVKIEGTKTAVGPAAGAAEEAMTRTQGIELSVRLNSDQIIAVVQEVSPHVRFHVGDRVRVLNINGTTRIAQ